MKRIRKALIAGAGAGIAPAAAVLAKAEKFDSATISQAIGAFIAAAAVVGWATYRVPNAPASR